MGSAGGELSGAGAVGRSARRILGERAVGWNLLAPSSSEGIMHLTYHDEKQTEPSTETGYLVLPNGLSLEIANQAANIIEAWEYHGDEMPIVLAAKLWEHFFDSFSLCNKFIADS